MRRWYWFRKLREVCQKAADFTDHLQPQNLVYFRLWLLVLYDYITRQENRIMNNHELFWKLTGDWGQEKTFWLAPHSARCDWLMRPRPSINQIQTLKCDPYNFSEHALSSVWKRRGTSTVRFFFQVILFNSVKLLLFAISAFGNRPEKHKILYFVLKILSCKLRSVRLNSQTSYSTFSVQIYQGNDQDAFRDVPAANYKMLRAERNHWKRWVDLLLNLTIYI